MKQGAVGKLATHIISQQTLTSHVVKDYSQGPRAGPSSRYAGGMLTAAVTMDNLLLVSHPLKD